MIHYNEQRVGVFIDVQNMYYSARHLFQRKVNFAKVVEEAVGDRRLIRALAYVVRTKGGEENSFIEALQKKGIETQEKDLLEYYSGQKKADWDVGITIDIIRMLDMLDVVVLVSGDGDFVPLVNFVQSRGRQVEVYSFMESTSGKLVEATDLHVNMSGDKRKFLIGPIQKNVKREMLRSVDDENQSSGGVFEETPDAEDEEVLEERRGRKLSF